MGRKTRPTSRSYLESALGGQTGDADNLERAQLFRELPEAERRDIEMLAVLLMDEVKRMGPHGALELLHKLGAFLRKREIPNCDVAAFYKKKKRGRGTRCAG